MIEAGSRRRASRWTAAALGWPPVVMAVMCSRTIGAMRAISAAGAPIELSSYSTGATPPSAWPCEVIRPSARFCV